MKDYRIAGLRFRSPIPLPAAEEECVGTAEVTVKLLEPRSIPDAAPEGVVYLSSARGRFRTWLTRTDAGYQFRISGMVDAWYPPDGGEIVAAPDTALVPGFLQALLAASLLSPLLSIRGATILHASGIVLNGQLVVIFGGSGSGKTTLAAALVAAGGALFTDDLMPLFDSGDALITYPCSHTLRIRAASFAEPLIPVDSKGQLTVDGRSAWRAAATVERSRPALLILPERRSDPGAQMSLIAPAQALVSLLQNGRRMPGVARTDWMKRDFLRLSRLAAECPAYRLGVSAGSFSPAEIRRQIEECLE